MDGVPGAGLGYRTLAHAFAAHALGVRWSQEVRAATFGELALGRECHGPGECYGVSPETTLAVCRASGMIDEACRSY